MLQNKNFEVKIFEVLEAGTYRVKLTDIEEIQGKKWGSEELETKWKWIFETVKEKNSVYEPFKLFYFTKPVYNMHEKAKLTILIKGLAGKILDAKEYQAFMNSTNDLIGRQVNVVVSKDEKSNGKVFNNIIAFFPVKDVMEEDEEEELPENLF